jgi:hypothetical protein
MGMTGAIQGLIFLAALGGRHPTIACARMVMRLFYAGGGEQRIRFPEIAARRLRLPERYRNVRFFMRSILRPSAALWLITLLLGLIALRSFFNGEAIALADSARFDHVHVVAPLFLHKGKQGLLLLDKRNGNVWFIAKGDELDLKYGEPVLVTHIPLEKLDQPQ